MLFEFWPLAFLGTIFSESLVAMAWGRLTKNRVPYLDVLVVNLVTHPAAFYLSALGIDFLALEAGVVMLEVVGLGLLGSVTWRQALILGVSCNLVSLSFSFF